MNQSRESASTQAPLLALEAIRIAEESARAAERSAAGALATLERAEESLKASEERMAEIATAASNAASEATEARLRATEIATEFRSLEERVAEALRNGMIRRRREASTAMASIQEAPAHGAPVQEAPAAAPQAGGTTAEFEALWDSFDRKADRIVQRLKEIEARTLTVIRTPMPTPRAENEQSSTPGGSGPR